METKNNGIASLRTSLDADITRFSDESSKHKRLHRKYQRAVIILTAVTTVVAGSGLISRQKAAKLFNLPCFASRLRQQQSAPGQK